MQSWPPVITMEPEQAEHVMGRECTPAVVERSFPSIDDKLRAPSICKPETIMCRVRVLKMQQALLRCKSVALSSIEHSRRAEDADIGRPALKTIGQARL